MTQKKKPAAKKPAAKKTTAAKKPAAKKTEAPKTEPAVEPEAEKVDPIVELLRKPLTAFVAGTRGYRELITRFNTDFKTQWNPWKVPAPTLYLIYKKMRAHYGIDE